jgi:predicted nucleic acid-binding Zn ribbon protein
MTTSRDQGPQRIGDILSRILVRSGGGRVLESKVADATWRDAVGPEMAAGSRPGALRRGVLEVVVRHSAFAQELAFRTDDILDKLQNQFPDAAIRELRFRVDKLD